MDFRAIRYEVWLDLIKIIKLLQILKKKKTLLVFKSIEARVDLLIKPNSNAVFKGENSFWYI